MIRREEAESTWLIHQAAHAYIAGQIANHWAHHFSPREELLIAAFNHDAGWAHIEQRPTINGQGKPRTFTEMETNTHFAIWTSSIEQVFAQNRYAGLLTSQHCCALYDQRLRTTNDSPDMQAQIQTFLDERRAWEQKLIARMEEHPRYALDVAVGALEKNLRLLQVWDYLSLLLCMGPVREQIIENVPFQRRDVVYVSGNGLRGMALDPYPLDQPLTLWIDAREISGGPYESDEEFCALLADVPYKALVFEIGPL